MSGARHQLLAIGEVMAEIRTDGVEGFALGFAGDSYNTAVYAAREMRVPGAVPISPVSAESRFLGLL